MKYLISVLTLLISFGFSFGITPEEALKLAKSKYLPTIQSTHIPCDCFVTGVCNCVPETCECEICYDYVVARKKAIAQNKPLVVWRGWVCPACIEYLQGKAVQCYLPSKTTIFDSSFVQRGTIACVPDGQGGMDFQKQWGTGEVDGSGIERSFSLPVPKFRKVVSQTAVPFDQGFTSTQTTGATTAGRVSSSYPVSTGTGLIRIPVQNVGMFGSTNCST